MFVVNQVNVPFSLVHVLVFPAKQINDTWFILMAHGYKCAHTGRNFPIELDRCGAR